MRKLCLFIACSPDGYIAAPGENLDFLKIVEKEGEDYGYQAFTSSVETIIIGRKTYDWGRHLVLKRRPTSAAIRTHQNQGF
ncbi:hypothetical protein [Lunatimonas salinarum]|uniref:hypothetical protein n=1 Tax=Lunatimonas salinarum TaxID=1774590 RepID=UPI00315853A6